MNQRDLGINSRIWSRCSWVLVAAIAGLLESELAAETFLHPDLGGVTTQVGNVRISIRRDGRIVSTVNVDRNEFHSSNFGLSGISRYGETGRLDVLSTARHRGQSVGWYRPYHRPNGRRPVGPEVSASPDDDPFGRRQQPVTTYRTFLTPPILGHGQ